MALNAVRPQLLETALRTCTRLPRTSTRQSQLHRVIRSNHRTQRRCISDGTRPPMPPDMDQKTRVVAPKTRLAVGVVFIGALIYSMVPYDLTTTSYTNNARANMYNPEGHRRQALRHPSPHIIIRRTSLTATARADKRIPTNASANHRRTRHSH